MVSIRLRAITALLAACALQATACAPPTSIAEMSVGSRVALESREGQVTEGILAEIGVNRVLVIEDSGERRELSRDSITAARQLQPPARICAP